MNPIKLLFWIIVMFLLALSTVFSAENVNVAGQANGGVHTSTFGIDPTNFNDDNRATYWNVNSPGGAHGVIQFAKNNTISNITFVQYQNGYPVVISCWNYTSNSWSVLASFTTALGEGGVNEFTGLDCLTDKLNFSSTAFAGAAYELEARNTTAPSDTCTAPGSGDWNVDCADNCNLNTAQTVPADMHLNGAGTIRLSAALDFTGIGSILSIGSGCALDIRSGGEIG